jgi:isochorismate synthase
MTSEDFFENLAQHYKGNLPFVAYRKPNTLAIKAILQKNSERYTTNNFTEKGFVFAPFDEKEDAVLIPSENSNTIICDYVISNENEKSYNEFYEFSSKEKQHHMNLVQKGIEAIDANQFQKVVLSRQESVSLSANNPILIFKRLLKTYPSAFVYCWFHPKVGLWLGATPETLLKLEGNRFSTMALAGTQTYNATLDSHWDKKEKKEQQIVTDYIVDNLSEVIEDINISETKTIRAGSLLHLRSDISGSIINETNYLRLLIKTLHPTPAVCGYPKEPAKQFILNNENYDREFYTGFLGEIDTDKSELFVNLRCMQLKNNKAILYVGGGITKDSIPESEWNETLNKAEIIKRVL